MFADASQVFLGVLVFVLERMEILELPPCILVAAGHERILLAHIPKGAIEEDVSVEGERKAERHEPYDGETDDDGELPTEGFTCMKRHERN